MNNFLYNKHVSRDESVVVSRYLVGGQGLRAGDCVDGVEVSVCNCCVFCLEEGSRCLENLNHVVFSCPAYDAPRARMVELGVLEKRTLTFHLHREIWRFVQLDAIRRC